MRVPPFIASPFVGVRHAIEMGFNVLRTAESDFCLLLDARLDKTPPFFVNFGVTHILRNDEHDATGAQLAHSRHGVLNLFPHAPPRLGIEFTCHMLGF
jgi:hypothetical protein